MSNVETIHQPKSSIADKIGSKKFFQPKLRINIPGDPYEQEADAMAESVMRMPLNNQFFFPSKPTTALGSWRKCAECEEEEKKLQRKQGRNGEAEASNELEGYVGNLNAGGQSLPDNVKNFFEPRFGSDFSDVRIHTDAPAAKSAQSINALAYTSGNNIVFNKDQFSPETDSGKKLMAHELTHVVQQQAPVNRKTIQRQGGAAAPAYGAACSGGARDPCQYARCTGKHDGILADLLRATDYVVRAVEALFQSPISDSTARALDWYFNSKTQETADEVAHRLRCIALCLLDTYGKDQYGCDPDYSGSSALAYVCVGATPVCDQVVTNVCLTNSYFGKSDRTRAEVLIHECAHRIGLSLGGPDFDVYDFKEHFLRLSTAEALMNADSFALFAGAIVNGVRTTRLTHVFPMNVGLSGGVALSGGSNTWYARINYFNMEFQHPALQLFNPNLGVSLSLIGDTTSATDPSVKADPSFLASLTAGFRITDARPGQAGQGYFSFWGGPSLALGLGSTIKAGLGAEAGVGVGYRWKWLDASVGGNYFYDPSRPEGLRNIFTLGPTISITFSPEISSGH